jgi:hypothetical protein
MDQEVLTQIAEITSGEISIEGHVKEALGTLLTQYKDQKKGLRLLSKKMGIHEKTLTRLLNQENKASYQTVFKIYRVFYNEFNDAKLIALVPQKIKEFLLKYNAQELSEEKNYTSNADKELQKNPVVAELFILAATGPLNIEFVETRFGNYGVNLLSSMVKSELLNEVHKGVYVLGQNQPQFTGETIVSVGTAMIAAHAKPDAGEELDKNFISFFAEGLSEEAYKEWLRIDQEAFKKKFELSRDQKNLGNVRAFTFMISESMQTMELH